MPSKTNETKNEKKIKETNKNTEKNVVKSEKNNEKEIIAQSKKNSTAKEFAVKVAETIKEASKKIIGSKPKDENTKKEVVKKETAKKQVSKADSKKNSVSKEPSKSKSSTNEKDLEVLAKNVSSKVNKTTSKSTPLSKTTSSKISADNNIIIPKETLSVEKATAKNKKEEINAKEVKKIPKEIIKKESKITTKTKSSSTKNKKDISISKTKSSKSSYKNKNTKSVKNTSLKKTKKKAEPVTVLEQYELPFRYNETIVKILYQTPNTLFVYWDISDKDRENYIKQFGEDFFNITYPVLIVHNDTMNYSFEVIINDFANSWYLRVNDSKCHYRVELGRKLINHFDVNKQEQVTVDNEKNITEENKAEIIKERINHLKNIREKFKNDYLFVSSSNAIELPNDHILFKTNENNTIKYRNIKTKQETSVSLFDIIKNLPLIDKTELPYVSNEILEGLYTAIYKNDDLSVLVTQSNPSSGGLSSSRMPHS